MVFAFAWIESSMRRTCRGVNAASRSRRDAPPGSCSALAPSVGKRGRPVTHYFENRPDRAVGGVAPDASRVEIRSAVEQVFGVRVTKVNTLNRKGKKRRNRRRNTFGNRPDTKRAFVTLHSGDRIDLFEQS